jgi:hypothetical protein
MSPVSPALTRTVRVLLVLGGLLIVAAGVAVPLWMARPREDLARLVPAQAAVAYWPKTSVAAAQRLVPWLPVLRDLPQTQGAVSLAVLLAADGGLRWVLTPLDPADDALPRNATVGSRRVVASAADVPGLLAPGTEPLASSLLYRRAAGRLSADAVYIARPGLSMTALAFLDATDARAVVLRPHAGGGEAILLTGTGTALPPAASVWMPALAAAPDLLVTAGNPDDLLRRVFALHAQDPTVAFAALAGAAAQILGPDASLRYDVLGLLHGPATLALGGSGRFLLTGNAAEGKDAAAALDRIRASAEAAAGAGTVEHARFSDQFSADILRPGDGAPTMTEETVHGWTVRTLRRGSGSMLLLASHGGEVALATDAAWLEQTLAGEREPVPAGMGRVWMAGRLSPAAASRWLPADDGALLRSAFGLPSSDALVWSASAADGLRTLMLRH